MPATEQRAADARRATDRLAGWLNLLPRILVLMLALGTGVAAVSAVRGILVQGDWMYSDGVMVYHVLRVRDGFSMYPDFGESPFLAMAYWPLYFLVSGLISRVAALEAHGAMYVMRALTVAGTVLGAVSVAGLVMACGARRVSALVAAGLFLTAYVVHPWAYAARSDLAGLGLALAGFLVLLKSDRLTSTAAAALLMAAGFSCKQTFIICIGTAGLVLLWRREWLRLVTLSAVWVLTVGALGLTMQLHSGGHFYLNTVTSNLLPFRLQTMLDHMSLYVSLSLPILVLAGVGWRGVPSNGRALGPVRIYLVLITVMSLVTVSRAGSYYNHLIEMTALLTVLAGVGFERCLLIRDAMASRTETPRWPGLFAMGVLAVAVGAAGLPLAALAFKAMNQPDRSALVEVIRNAPGPVLTEKDAMAVVLAGKEPIGGDPLGVALFARKGIWEPEPLNAMVRSQQFALIVLNRPIEESAAFDDFDWWPPGTPELMQQQYRFERRLGTYYLYVPKAETNTEARP
jgi:hypothetical protein